MKLKVTRILPLGSLMSKECGGKGKTPYYFLQLFIILFLFPLCRTTLPF